MIFIIYYLSNKNLYITVVIPIINNSPKNIPTKNAITLLIVIMDIIIDLKTNKNKHKLAIHNINTNAFFNISFI